MSTDERDPGQEEAAVQSGFVPDELDDHGKRVWSKLTPDLNAAGRLKLTDVAAMTRYCDMAGRYWRMAERVREEGETILTPTIAKDGDGQPGEMWRRHPLLSEMKSLIPELRQLEDRFGMSPKARYELTSKALGGAGGTLFDVPPQDRPGHDGSGADDPANFH